MAKPAELSAGTLPGPVDQNGSSDSGGGGATRRLVSAGAVMAAGTALSRVLGFVRLILLVVLFGNATRQADMFAIANTVPNSMYILLAGGVLNSVLVPQLVRAIRGDADGGEAYTQRIMTAGLLVLGAITILLTLAVPVIIGIYSGADWKAPRLGQQYASMTTLAYYCMPQVFFYGVHVLAGQVLNARDRFGPMMWAPIANNVVSIAVLGIFLRVFGRTDTGQAFTSGQELLLGLGSTVGIVVQAAVLVPYLKAAGFRFAPRFDFRHTGLGHTFSLARWTLGFLVATQLALVVVNRLATGATAGGRGAGLTAYGNAYAVWILPHSLITISLTTAMLPSASRLAVRGDLPGVAAETTRTIRLATTALLPAAVGFVVLGLPMAQLAFGFGRGGRDASFVGWTLMALAVGLVPFTVQYVFLRAFYALEDTRSTFFLQVGIAAVNVVAAVAIVFAVNDPRWVAPSLGLSYSLSYCVGVVLSYRRLHQRLNTLSSYELVRHCTRLLLASLPAGAVGWVVCWVLTGRSGSRVALALALALAGVAAAATFLLVARLLRIEEVSGMVAVLRRRRRPAPAADLASGEQVAAENRTSLTVPHPGDESTSPGDLDTVIRPGSPSMAPPTTAGATPGERSLDQIPEVAVGPAEDAAPMTQTVPLTPPGSAAAPPGGGSGPDGAPVPGLGAGLGNTKAATLPAGTLLASRYRLEELIADSRPSVTWRAFDEVLSRSVLVHVLAPGDPDEPELLAAARRASVATDSRFLRVLDAVHSEDTDLGSYIVCEYATGQSLEVLLSHAPLSGLEAAWVVREVADALAGVHGLGLFHRRINPETVIITPAGNVKIVGLLIDAALRPNRSTTVPGADTGELVDVTDLGRLLYSALVSRWPGGPAYSLAPAPRLGRRWMSPRQVRAGVSPALDHVCDQVLGDPPRHRAAAITDAAGLVNALTKVLGNADASTDLERRLHQPIPLVGGERAGPTPSAPDAAPVSPLLEQPTEEMTAVRPAVRRAADAPASRPSRVVPLTGAGPTAVTSTVTSAPRPSHGSERGRPGGTGSAATGSVRVGQRQPRRWIAVLILLCALLVAAAVVSAQVLDRRLSGTPVGTPAAAPPAPASTGPASPPPTIPIRAVRDFDPQGKPREENSDEVRFAIDGDPKTRWRTVNYIGNPKLGGIKRGVGLVLDLGTAQPVGSVSVQLSGQGTDVQFRVPKGDPATVNTPPMTSDTRWRTVAKRSKVRSSTTLTSTPPVTTRFVLIYLTSLPKEGTGYRGGIYEVEVKA